MSLMEFYNRTKKPFRVYDDISGECLSLLSLKDNEVDPLRLNWNEITVEATEDCGSFIAVYVSY